MAFRAAWLAATALTGVVAGFMLSHAILLGRFLDWLLEPGRAATFAATYPLFTGGVGRSRLTVYYAVCGAQVVAALAFLAMAVRTRRHRGPAAAAAVAAVLWPAVHYGTGFGALEAQVLRSTTAVSPDLAARFVAWNGPVHLAHAAVLGCGLIALLAVPLRERTRD